jgi:anti-sigma factor RsiW
VTHPKDDLTAYLDGALAPARRAEVEAHLVGCAACRAEHARLAVTVTALGALPLPPEPSPFFATRLTARLAAEPAPRAGPLARLLAWRWRLAVPAVGLAAVAAVALLAPRHQLPPDLALVTQLELLEDYEAVASLGDVETAEDAAVVASLHDLARPGRTP